MKKNVIVSLSNYDNKNAGNIDRPAAYGYNIRNVFRGDRC